MGASSVTGISGVGMAGPVRGPGNNRNQYCSLVDPHIVWHGTVVLEGEGPYVATVLLPSDLSGKHPPTHFALFIAGKGWAYEKLVDGDGNMTGFTVWGATEQPVDFIVIDANNNCFCEDYILPVS